MWRGRYTGCDKGYFVELPLSVVAHGAGAPGPNNGFLVSTTAPAADAQVAADHPGFIAVFAEYNSLGLRNAKAYLDWELKDTAKSDLIEVRQTRFQGLPAAEAEYRAMRNGRAEVNNVLIAFRLNDDLVYEIRLCSSPAEYAPALPLYEKNKAGFHVFRIPKGECENP